MKRTTAFVIALLLAAQALADLTLREDTASQAVKVGPFVDTSGAIVSSLTIDAADVRISKNGANIAGKNSGGCTYDEVGMYDCTFDATDTSTVGRLQVTIVETGALPVYHEYQVVEEAVYDACCAAAAAPLTNAGIAAAVAGLDVSDNDDVADSWGERLSRIPNVAPGASGGLPTTDASNRVTALISSGTGSGQISITSGLLAWNPSWDAEVESEVDDSIGGGTGTALTAIPWNASWDTEVQSEADDALVAIHLDHLLAVDYDPASKPGTATALLNELIESDAGVSQFTANALEEAPTGSGASVSAIADAVWDEVLSGHLTAGTTGAALDTATTGGGLDAAGVRAALGMSSANLDTQLSTIDDYVDAEVAAILVDTGTTLDDLVDDLESRLGTPSNLGGGATVAANLSDIEGQTDDIGSAGAGLTAIDLPNQTMDITGNLSGSVGSVTGAVGSVTGAVASVTGNVGGNVVGSVASVSGAVGSVTGNVGGNVTGSVGSVASGGITDTSLAASAGTEIAQAVADAQRNIIGTCDSGSTTTCVDNALTQADASQLEDRLICFDDGWCGLITTFTPASDTATTTKVAPSTRASKAYTIFPSTLE